MQMTLSFGKPELFDAYCSEAENWLDFTADKNGGEYTIYFGTAYDAYRFGYGWANFQRDEKNKNETKP